MAKTAETSRAAKSFIHASMPVAEIVTLCPEAESVLKEYGLHCFGCAASSYETLGDGCRGHGFGKEEIDELVDDLNKMIEEMPERPQDISLTVPAARAIRDVAKSEGKEGEGLCVIADGHGGFCMEFRAEATGDERTFINVEEPDVRIFASSLTLKRIGGATIDFREGRFKLDLAEDAGKQGCACSTNGSCSCN